MRYRLRVVLLALCLSCSMIPSIGLAGLDEGVTAYRENDYVAAIREFKSAATQGDPTAQMFLGMMYSNGKGVPKDYKEAMKWYRLVADQGHAEGQYALGMAYNFGRGVTQDVKEALKWFRLAANQGHANAQENLGTIYYVGNADGKGVAQDNKEAVKWFRLAADQGKADAQYNLGVMYSNGQGVTSNRLVAYALINLSKSMNLYAIANLMSAKEIEAGQELTRELAKPGNLLKTLDKYTKQSR